MTVERLYLQDAYLTRFHAAVVERLTWEGRPAVVLDRSAFYPEGGGQPADRGWLNGVPVVDVRTREEDAAVIHVLAEELTADRVEGVVDWPRRYDHMQQHTAQHVLSQAFIRVAEAETVGFHLGERYTTIDLDIEVSPEEVARAEHLANQILEENRGVRARFVTPEELARLNVRRPPKVAGPVRLVEIEDFDVVPCGGTHVARTGEIGLLAITRVERYKGGVRVTFLAGRRARADYARRRSLLARLGELLTCGEGDLIPRVERLLAEHKAMTSALRRARERLLEIEAERLWQSAPRVNGVRVIVAAFDDWEVEQVRTLAGMLRNREGAIVILGWRGSEKGRFVFARTSDVGVHMGQVLRQALADYGGRGGGRPDWAEGGVDAPARVDDVLAAAVRLTEESLNSGPD